MSKNILVIPGSGKQGRGTCSALTKQGFNVHALVRDPASANSQQLQKMDVTLHKGDLDDITSVQASMKDIQGLVFSILAHPFDEQRQASNVISAAAEAGVKHIVYSSVAQTGEHEKFPGWGENFPLSWYWLNKQAIEDMVRSSSVPAWTILRPAFFMQNFTRPTCELMFPGLADHQELRAAYTPDTRLDLVDVVDIGVFAGEAFRKPEDFHGKALALAGESLTLAEIATRLSTISGKPVKPRYLTEADVEKLRRQQWLPVESFEWQREVGYQVDIDGLRQLGVPLRTLDDALSKDSLGW
ncbi:Putative NmrA-like domain, NAD(P)-binding domain superfamily [Colletotrichum destructivum]|uniref:NmrA-like domain, NAD(P)-binding domain superfamily n=1 Tax=Colletotrichum destructivum TaxID=34406 RepID=A0AAX4J3B5_9PEZI|nr:Putative NmrA-like domain, NAD(P)-binding domain superfamily [Colletotrichum destructivum]